MPKSRKPKSELEALDSPDVYPAAEVGSGSDADAVIAAKKQTKQCVLTKIDSSVTAAAGELRKKIDNLASDLTTEILSVCAEFTKLTEEVQKENVTFVTCIGDLEEEDNSHANIVIARGVLI